MRLQDWNCGDRTYDTNGGYNHQGIDIFTWPFSFNQMDNNHAIAVAAADGIIILKTNGNFDRSCTLNGNTWNAVYIQHSDGSQSWYGHLKNGSLTTKNVGDFIASGEYVGVVGSSGNSTGPHLHFEVYNNLGPGLLENVYEAALMKEFELIGLKAKNQLALPVTYKQYDIELGYRIDILVENKIIIEIKSVKALEDNKIKPAGQPKLDLKTYGEDKDLEYVMSITELPKVELKSVENIKFDEYSVKIDTKETDKRI